MGPRLVRGGALIVGGLVAAVVAVVYTFRFYSETSDAYASYTTGLARRLAVCVNGLAVAPCEQLAPPPAVAH